MSVRRWGRPQPLTLVEAPRERRRRGAPAGDALVLWAGACLALFVALVCAAITLLAWPA